MAKPLMLRLLVTPPNHYPSYSRKKLMVPHTLTTMVPPLRQRHVVVSIDATQVMTMPWI